MRSLHQADKGLPFQGLTHLSSVTCKVDKTKICLSKQNYHSFVFITV